MNVKILSKSCMGTTPFLGKAPKQRYCTIPCGFRKPMGKGSPASNCPLPYRWRLDTRKQGFSGFSKGLQWKDRE